MNRVSTVAALWRRGPLANRWVRAAAIFALLYALPYSTLQILSLIHI